MDFAPGPKNHVEVPRHKRETEDIIREKIDEILDEHPKKSIAAIILFVAFAVQAMYNNMNPGIPDSPYDGVIISDPYFSNLYQCTKEKFSELATGSHNSRWQFLNCRGETQDIIDEMIEEDPQNPLKQLTKLRDQILTTVGHENNISWTRHIHGKSEPPTAAFRHHGNSK